MKRIAIILLILLGLIASIAAYLILGNATTFSGNNKAIIITQQQTNKPEVLKLLKNEGIIKSSFVFEQVGNQLNIWDRIKEGKYKINKGDNVLQIARMLRNNNQVSVNLVINKIRTPQDLAKLIGKSFSTDSLTAIQYLLNNNNLAKINADSNSFLFNIIPNTYTFYWNTSVEKIIEKLAVESKKFWDNNNRTQKAEALGLTPYEIYTIASIVEEETNKDDEKGNIASVYINRLHANMPLGADPTIKYALHNFALRRILLQHLQVQSPYNTYKNKGLPPGAICTPSIKTIDAVLAAPPTQYLFFVAKDDFSGYHHFSTTFAEHDKYAKQYQQALNEYLKKKILPNK